MTRLECIKDNTFLLGLNMSKATKEQKIHWLCQIIDNETDKPEDEIDFALIDECSAYLRELSEKAAEATKEQKRRILQQIKAHHNQTATKSAKVLRPNWRKVGRIVAIAATVATILLSTLTVLAKVNGYSSAWEYVKDNLQKIASMDSGDRVNDGGITLIKNDGVVAYKSIEELLESEGLDIMYPSELPEGVQITKVLEQIISEENTVYCYQFNDYNLSVLASTAQSVSLGDLQKYEILETETMVFYFEQTTDDVYQVIGVDTKYEYRICCDDYDVLIEILNGMKRIGK